MTVAQLIARLQALDPDHLVVAYDKEGYLTEIDDVVVHGTREVYRLKVVDGRNQYVPENYPGAAELF